ncbi:MAG: ATP-binding protein [Clostridiales bacterium]|nr:ATP-binding protein [Clostridiales bacterium]
MDIRRDKYLHDLVIRMHNGLIKVITGMRRSGKSYLMNEIFFDYLISTVGIGEDHIIKFAFDSADDLELIGEDLLEIEKEKRKVDPKKFMSYVKDRVFDDQDYYLLIDEVQNLGSFESVLNGYLRKKNFDIYVTGSNSKFLSSDVITEFEGRGDEIHVFPLSFKEFLSAYNGTEEKAYEEYSMYGGLPLLVSMKTDVQKTKYLEGQIKNTYLKDIVNRYGLRNDENIGELLNVLSSGMSTLTNPSKLERAFKSKKNASISRTTINEYIDHFIDAFLLSKALRYDVKGKNYIETPFKLYFEDVGIRNARLGFRQIEPTHLMENIIYNELRYRGFNVDVGVVETRKTKNGKTTRNNYEVDFVATLGSQKYYIQSAYDIPNEEKWAKETASFDNIDDSFQKIVIVKNPIVNRYSENGYRVIGLKDFLLNDSFFN